MLQLSNVEMQMILPSLGFGCFNIFVDLSYAEYCQLGQIQCDLWLVTKYFA